MVYVKRAVYVARSMDTAAFRKTTVLMGRLLLPRRNFTIQTDSVEEEFQAMGPVPTLLYVARTKESVKIPTLLAAIGQTTELEAVRVDLEKLETVNVKTPTKNVALNGDIAELQKITVRHGLTEAPELFAV